MKWGRINMRKGGRERERERQTDGGKDGVKCIRLTSFNCGGPGDGQ